MVFARFWDLPFLLAKLSLLCNQVPGGAFPLLCAVIESGHLYVFTFVTCRIIKSTQ